MKKVRWLCFVVSLCLLACCLGGCEKPTKKKEEPDLSVIIAPSADVLDPVYVSLDNDSMISRLFFEGLLGVSRDGTLGAGVAEKWERSEDGLSYRFYLRSAFWADGQRITATDFIYSWNRLANPKTGANFCTILADVKREADGSLAMKAIDEKTLEVTLARPVSYFLELCAMPCLAPVRKDIIEKYGDAWTKRPETFIGNGPFVLKKYSTTALDVKKNEHYWDKDNVKINYMRVRLVQDDGVAEAAFDAKEAQLTLFVPNERRDFWKGKPEFQIAELLGTHTIVFNSNVKPLDNPRVCRALGLAMDRPGICDHVLKQGNTPAWGLVPPGLHGVDKRIPFRDERPPYFDPHDYKGNLEKAKQELIEAGYPGGKGLEFTITARAGGSGKLLAEKIKSDFAKIGVGIKIRLMEQTAYWSIFKSGDFELAVWGWCADFSHPITMFTPFTSGSGNNPLGVEIPEVSELVEQAKRADPEACMGFLHDAEAILIKRPFLSPIAHAKRMFLKVPNLHGVVLTPSGEVILTYAGLTSL